MKRDKARTLFEAGALMACEVVPAPMEGAGWALVIVGRDSRKDPLETTRKGQIRYFRTLDAAAREAGIIGFRNVTLYL